MDEMDENYPSKQLYIYIYIYGTLYSIYIYIHMYILMIQSLEWMWSND